MAVEAHRLLPTVRGRGVDDAAETKQRYGDRTAVDLASTPYDHVAGPPLYYVPPPATATASGATFVAAPPRKRARGEEEEPYFVGAPAHDDNKRRVIGVHPAVLQHVQRMNAELQQWRLHATAVAERVQAKDEEIDQERWRNWLLQEQLAAAHAESRAWRDAAANALRADLDHALRALAEAEANADAAEDAASCCSGSGNNDDDGGGTTTTAGVGACRGCGERGAAVVVLPCRHLSACAPCAAAAAACPACGGAKVGSVAVNLV